MPECGRRAPGPRRVRIANREFQPASDAVMFFSAAARHADGGVPIGRLTRIPRWRCNMSDVWNQCEGQVIDNKFRLQRYLGGTEDSAVFLTQLARSPAQKPSIKFIPPRPTAH